MYGNKGKAMKSLAKLGRKGDNKLREVGGQPSHVNALEAYLIDNFGDSGREATQRMGSGTINPNTGLREYFTLPGGLGSFFGEDSSGETWAAAISSKDWFDKPRGWQIPAQMAQDTWQAIMPTYYTDPETGKEIKSSRMFQNPDKGMFKTQEEFEKDNQFQYGAAQDLESFEKEISRIPTALKSEVEGIRSAYTTGKKSAEEQYGEWSSEGEYLGGGAIEDIQAVTGEWEQDPVTGEWTYVEGTGGTGIETLLTAKERAIETAFEGAEEGQMALGSEYAGAKAETSKALGATGMARHGGITSQFENIESSIYGGLRGSGEEFAKTQEVAKEDFESGLTELSNKYSQTYETSKDKYDIKMKELRQNLEPYNVSGIVSKYDADLSRALEGFSSSVGTDLESYLSRVAGRKSAPYDAAIAAIETYRNYDPRTGQAINDKA